METVTLSINGKTISCPSGTTILDVAGQHGITIPTLCNHPDLRPHGGCRLCIVEDETTGRLFASCVTPVSGQMVLKTHTDRVVEHRRNILLLMMAEHPDSCLICSKGNDCQLRKLAGEHDIGESDLHPMFNYTPIDQSNPFIFRDMTKCILCSRCIRACKELVVNGVIDFNSRGFKSRPSTALGLPLAKSECTFCGTCVSVCPTGALTQSTGSYSGTPETEKESVCGFCGSGCRVSLGITAGNVSEINPSRNRDSVNAVTLCVRGHFGVDYLNSDARLREPKQREGDEFVPVPWEDAVSKVHDTLVEISNKYGPESIGFYGSSKCTNEENYLFQKLARAVFKTANIDNGGFVYGRNLMEIVDRRTGGTCRVNKFSDLETSEVIVVAGAEPGQSIPVLGYHIKRAVKNGATLIVLDHRETELVMYADIWLKPYSGIDLVRHYTELTNGISAQIYRDQGTDLQFVEWFTDNYDEFTRELEQVNLDDIARNSGVDREAIKKTASLIIGKRTSFVIGGEILEQKNGEPAMNALVNLSLMAGSFGCQGGGIYPLAKENNLIGSWDMGTVPDMLPGRYAVDDTGAVSACEKAWGVPVKPATGLDMPAMIEAAENGSLKALYIMGENPLRSLPQPGKIKKAFQNLEFLVVQDILETETTAQADMVLPGAATCEKTGSFTNMEGRIQSVDAAVPPPGTAKSDFDILNLLLQRGGVKACSLKEVRNEIGTISSLYEELPAIKETAWLKSEVPDKTPNGEKYGRIQFSGVAHPERAVPDTNYPLTAVIGIVYYHSGSGTRTALSDRITRAPVQGDIEISETVARKLGFDEGNTVRIVSPNGSISRTIRFNPSMNGDTIFIPRAFHNNDVMNLFSLTTPENNPYYGWKRCQVRIEKE